MNNRSEPFARLLKGAINSIAAYEGKTAPAIENELGEKIGVSGATIQRWKSGALPTDERAVQILAEAAIRRGYLGREWLQRFLHAARYPFADQLLDQLCPIGPARPRPPRVYQNLPAPTYSQFVMRQQPFDEILDGLTKRSAAVVIVGLGGNGKTSLAREVASRCLTSDSKTPQFDAAVWVSDKDRPGTTNLSIVLDEIARTLDYPGFTQFEFDEKRREVENLLRRLRVLIIIDNFETITDGVLLTWLLNLPEPSKALITIREYRREFRRGGWPVEIRGMTDTEAREFVSERLRVLRIEKLISEPSQLEPLIAATGGNPKAIELTLGLVKYERRSLQQVVDDLYAARGELFDDLFTRAWSLLNEDARCVLLVMTFFPDSASGAVLQATANVQSFAFDRAMERLTDLALLDVQQADMNSTPRYTMHPLVRAFAGARLIEQPRLEQEARVRWQVWYGAFLNQHDAKDWPGFALVSEEYNNITAVIDWAIAHQDPNTTALVQHFWYFLYIRGHWPQCERYTQAACDLASGDTTRAQRLWLTSHLGWLLTEKEGRLRDALGLLHQVEAEIIALNRPDLLIETQVINYLGQAAISRRELDLAQTYFERFLTLAQERPREFLVAHYYLAVILLHRGQIEEAASAFRHLVSEAEKIKYERARGYCSYRLAEALTYLGQFDEAERLLLQAGRMADHWREPLLQASVLLRQARLLWRQDQLAEAYAVALEARSSFQLLGAGERRAAEELINRLEQAMAE